MAILTLSASAVGVLSNWDLEVGPSSLIHSNLLRSGANRSLLVSRCDTKQSEVAEVLLSAVQYFHLQKMVALAANRLKCERADLLSSGWLCSLQAFMVNKDDKKWEKSSKWHWRNGENNAQVPSLLTKPSPRYF